MNNLFRVLNQKRKNVSQHKNNVCQKSVVTFFFGTRAYRIIYSRIEDNVFFFLVAEAVDLVISKWIFSASFQQKTFLFHSKYNYEWSQVDSALGWCKGNSRIPLTIQIAIPTHRMHNRFTLTLNRGGRRV